MRKKKAIRLQRKLHYIIDSFIENGLIQVRGDRENTAFQIANEPSSPQISLSHESCNDGTENAEENQCSDV